MRELADDEFRALLWRHERAVTIVDEVDGWQLLLPLVARSEEVLEASLEQMRDAREILAA
jgi:hypothetical protein